MVQDREGAWLMGLGRRGNLVPQMQCIFGAAAPHFLQFEACRLPHASFSRMLVNQEVELLVRAGEYRKGADPLIDPAIAKIDKSGAKVLASRRIQLFA
ncbi:hypothetical protein [Mesorhizobium sp.]|uniref:hypothetical protein n=1 Tax=Mesorhizobium sp. TaxID=1871066 RepID=UPI00121E6A4C|nr:hypothetical protein [Mesorhizobium sp.]TIN74358.1 MAG: hypothetical protein E5Y09_33215 [Mesorhizobium sp.]